MIAGAGFALMAMHLANERSTRGILKITPYPRGHCNAYPRTPSHEYYHIIDRATEAVQLGAHCPICTNRTLHL